MFKKKKRDPFKVVESYLKKADEEVSEIKRVVNRHRFLKGLLEDVKHIERSDYKVTEIIINTYGFDKARIPYHYLEDVFFDLVKERLEKALAECYAEIEGFANETCNLGTDAALPGSHR